MAKQSTVSLDEVMDQAEAASQAGDAQATSKTAKKKAGAKGRAVKAKKPSGPTVLIGGNFPPEMADQLALIAAEERTTKKDLIGEALNALFVKKGKKKVSL